GGWLVLATLATWWVVPALLLQAIFVNTLFGAMHESVHYGSFKTRWMADLLAFFSGAAILNNAGFYRHYHLAHHHYTQDPGLARARQRRRPVGVVHPPAGRPAAAAPLSAVRAHALPQQRRRLRQHPHHPQQSRRALADVEPALSRRAPSLSQHRLSQPARSP